MRKIISILLFVAIVGMFCVSTVSACQYIPEEKYFNKEPLFPDPWKKQPNIFEQHPEYLPENNMRFPYFR